MQSQEQPLTQICRYSQENIKYTKKVQITQKQVGRNNERMKNEGNRESRTSRMADSGPQQILSLKWNGKSDKVIKKVS